MSHKAREHLGAATALLGIVAVELEALQAENERLHAAASQLQILINAAGVHNLSNGVQLGQISWLVKMNDAMAQCEAALAHTDAADKAARAEGVMEPEDTK